MPTENGIYLPFEGESEDGTKTGLLQIADPGELGFARLGGDYGPVGVRRLKSPREGGDSWDVFPTLKGMQDHADTFRTLMGIEAPDQGLDTSDTPSFAGLSLTALSLQNPPPNVLGLAEDNSVVYFPYGAVAGLGTIADQGEWSDVSPSYDVGSVVTHNFARWISRVSLNDVEPGTDNTKWVLTGPYAADMLHFLGAQLSEYDFDFDSSDPVLTPLSVLINLFTTINPFGGEITLPDGVLANGQKFLHGHMRMNQGLTDAAHLIFIIQSNLHNTSISTADFSSAYTGGYLDLDWWIISDGTSNVISQIRLRRLDSGEELTVDGILYGVDLSGATIWDVKFITPDGIANAISLKILNGSYIETNIHGLTP